LLRKSDSLRFSCSSISISHNEGVLPSVFAPPFISGWENALYPIDIDFIENYLWLLCRVAKQEHNGGDAC